MINYSDLINDAASFAINAHLGQLYGNKPYSYHLNSVVNKLRSFEEDYVITDEVIAAGYLHDVLEDTEATKQDLSEIFGDSIADAVDILSRKKDQLDGEYIDKIRFNNISLIVKIADTLCNLEESVKSQEKHRIVKYCRQLMDLTN